MAITSPSHAVANLISSHLVLYHYHVASEQPGTDNTDNAAPEPLHEQENASSNLPALKKKRSHEESEETTTSSDPETKRVACDTNPPESVASSTTEGSKGAYIHHTVFFSF